VEQLVRPLSHLLEIDSPKLTADDLLDLGDECRDVLTALKVLVPARNARHVVCDACHEDHVGEVTRTKSPGGETTFHIRCPNAGWALVPEQRLRQWTIDVQRVVSLLSQGIGPGEVLEPLIDGAAWRLGQASIAGEQFAIVLFRGCADADDSLLDRVAARSPRPRTILVGTGDLSDASGFAAVASLATAFDFADGKFAIQPERIRSLLHVADSLQGNVFRLVGDYWHVSFDGKTTHLEDVAGHGYIARLLAEPKRNIPAVTLLAARAGLDPRVAAGSLGEQLDDVGRATFRKRYEELSEELEEAQKNNDLGRVTKVQADMDSFSEELSRATGLGGRPRQTTDADRVRKSVSMAVTRSIERVATKHPALGRHLEKFITSGYTFRYDPEPLVDWLT
jgi:hypothetical protein